MAITASLESRLSEISTNTRYQIDLFSKDYLPDALKAAQKFSAENGGLIASMPELVKLFITNPTEVLKYQSITSLSEEVKGETHGGNRVVVVVHGWAFLNTPERFEESYNRQIPGYSTHIELRRKNDIKYATYSKEEFHNLLKGMPSSDNPLRMLIFDEFVEIDPKDLPGRYGIIIDEDLVVEYAAGTYALDDLPNIPLFVARVGGISQAEALVRTVEMVSGIKEYGNWHPFGGEKVYAPMGRLLRMYRVQPAKEIAEELRKEDIGLGIDGDYSNSRNANFLVFKPI